MKKIQILVLSLIALGWTSCSSNDNEEKEQPKVVLTTPEQQKEKLEKVTTNLVNKVHANDFKNVQDVLEDLDNANTETVETWWGAIVDEIPKLTRVARFSGTPEYQNYTALYRASNFVGHFRLVDKKWVKENGTFNDLQFSFADRNGKPCVARLTTSGKETAVKDKYLNSEKSPVYLWDYDAATDTYTKRLLESGRRYENTWMLPENVALTLTQGGTTIMDVKVNTQLSSGQLTSTTNVVIKTNVKINNYEVDVKRAWADVAKGASADVKVMVNGETLLAAHAEAEGSYNVEKEEGKAGKASAVCDILGEMQLRLSTDNLQAYSEKLDEVTNSDKYSKAEIDALIAQANREMSITLHYDNSSEASAKVYMNALSDGGYEWTDENGKLHVAKYWNFEPVIEFADKTTYAFEDYFTSARFKTVVDLVNDLVRDFEKRFAK